MSLVLIPAHGHTLCAGFIYGYASHKSISLEAKANPVSRIMILSHQFGRHEVLKDSELGFSRSGIRLDSQKKSPDRLFPVSTAKVASFAFNLR